MRLHAIVLALAAAVTVPGVADVTNLCRIGTATAGGWHSVDAQGNPGGIRDGSALWAGSYYGSTAALADGYYYIYWGQDAQAVQTIRWMGSLVDSSRSITSFTLWALNDNADPTKETSWTSLGSYTVPAGKLFCQVVLPKAVTTQGIKLSYTNQTRPLTGEFELFSRDLTPLPVVSFSASSALYGAADNAFDGDPMTSYGSAGLNNGPGYMELYLGEEEQSVGALQIYFRVQMPGYYGAPTAFTVSAWDSTLNKGDGGWVLLDTQTHWDNSEVLYGLDLPGEIMTNKIRLDVTTPYVGTSLPGGSFGIMEFFVYKYLPPVPEPATMTLLALGGLALLRKRRAV